MRKFISLGTDPEFLLIGEEGRPASSLRYNIPGDKYNPVPLDKLGEGYSIQKDNVLVEFCIPPVFNDNGITAEDGRKLFNRVIRARDYANDYFLPRGASLHFATCAKYDKSELDNEYARTFGCSESINAWTEESFKVIADPDNLYRGIGFHLHIGYTDPNPDVTVKLVKLLDLFLAVPDLLNGDYVEDNKIRRRQYGRAGDFRFTAWGGFEYRSLGTGSFSRYGNMINVVNGINAAFEALNKGIEIPEDLGFEIQLCVNTANKEMVQGILEGFKEFSGMSLPSFNSGPSIQFFDSDIEFFDSESEDSSLDEEEED